MGLLGALVKTPIFQATPDTGSAGYTLLEILVVLAITSMIAATAPTVYAALVPGYQVRQFANDLANNARRLRMQAQKKRSLHVLEFVENSNVYRIDGEVIEGPEGLKLDLDPSTAWNLALADKIEFYPNGATSGGLVKLSYGNVSVKVRIDWTTGKIEVEQ